MRFGKRIRNVVRYICHNGIYGYRLTSAFGVSVHAGAIMLLMSGVGWFSSPTAALAQDVKQPSQGEAVTITDNQMAFAIETELALAEDVPSHLIDIEVADGIATLTGRTDNILARERATEITETIKGVRAVVNRIDVYPPERADGMIRDDIRRALNQDPATEGYDVSIDVRDGEVTLGGELDSWTEKRLALEVTKGVKGVKSVQDTLRVEHPTGRSDDEIKKEVERRLAFDVWVDATRIDVAVDDGTVTLSGAVRSAAERTRAQADAWTSGAQQVHSEDLEVRWQMRDETQRTKKYRAHTQQEIQTAIRDALTVDPRTNPNDIDISVDRGVVTLTGFVPNIEAKKAAIADARRTIGVWRVKDHVRVRPNAIPADGELKKQVDRALEIDPYVSGLDVSTEVDNGLVTLDGEVNTSFEKKHAAAVASGVEGVVDVQNNIDYLHEWTYRDDVEIDYRVQNQLFWNPNVDEHRLSVQVDDGVVTLTGAVDTWYERELAEAEAYDGGAKDVRNHLSVRNGYPSTLPLSGN